MTFIHWDIRIDLRESLHLDLWVILLLLEGLELLMIRLDFILVMMISRDICKGLYLLLCIISVVLASVYKSRAILMHAWVVKSWTWSVYPTNTLRVCVEIFLMACTLVLRFLWSLRRPCVCAHCIWKFRLALCNDLERFLLLEVKLAFLAVRRSISNLANS